MIKLKNISFLLFIFSLTSLYSQDNYLLDSIISTDILNNSIDNKTFITYDTEGRITREESFARIIKFTYPSSDISIVEYYNSLDTTEYLNKEIRTLDPQDRIIARENYQLEDGSETLKSIDTFKYKDENTDYYFYYRYAILDGNEVIQNTYELFYDQNDFIDSTSVVNYETNGDIKSYINRGITLNKDNQDSIVANRRFFNGIQYLDSTYILYNDLEQIERKIIRYQNGIYDMTFLYEYVREGNKLNQIGMKTDSNNELYHFNDLIFWEVENDFIEYDSTYNISYVDEIAVNTRINTYIMSQPIVNQLLISHTAKTIINENMTQHSLEERYYNNRNIVSTEEAEINNINIYPNPITSNDFIEIRAEKTFDKVDIYNSSGLLVRTKSAKNNTIEFIEAPSNSGIYFIRIYNTNTLQGIKRIIVIE